MFFFVGMKIFYASFLLILVVSLNSASAQEVDSIPIDTKGLDIKLKRSPLPSRTGNLNFKAVPMAPIVVNAKVNYWKTRTSVGINFSQAAFSNNWTGGGVNSVALGGVVNYKAEYSKENYSYVSELILEYGKVRNKGQLQKKTRDRIFWDNKAAIQLSKNWYFFGSINFESQFDKGFRYFNDAAGVESTAATLLKSPAFSTVNYSSASVKFNSFLYDPFSSGGTVAKVQASIDGVTWGDLQTITPTTTTTGTVFAPVTVALTAAYLNQPVVYVRFNYAATWRYY